MGSNERIPDRQKEPSSPADSDSGDVIENMPGQGQLGIESINTAHNHPQGNADSFQPHSVLGPYRLLDRLGEGRMGQVWRADQTQPVKRRVALKVIKQSIGSQDVLARFEAERQALAMMNHPNIARMLDAGKTPDGKVDKAIPLLEESYRMQETIPTLPSIAEPLRLAYKTANRADDHKRLAEEQLKIVRQQFRVGSREMSIICLTLGDEYLSLGTFDRADQLFQEGLQSMQKLAPEEWRNELAKLRIGAAKMGKKEWSEAIDWLTRSYQGMQKAKGKIPQSAFQQNLGELVDRLVICCEKPGDQESLKKWSAIQDSLAK